MIHLGGIAKPQEPILTKLIHRSQPFAQGEGLGIGFRTLARVQPAGAPERVPRRPRYFFRPSTAARMAETGGRVL